MDARRLWLLAALGLAPVAPRGADATLLTLTGSTLTVSLSTIGEATVPQNVPALPVLVSSGGGSFTEPAGLFTGTVVVPKGTGAPPIVSGFTLVVSNWTKQIAQGAEAGSTYFGIHRAGGGLGGPGRLTGTAIVNILGLFNLHVPLFPVGNTDQYVTSSGPPPSSVLTVIGTGWTTGDVTITGLSTQTPSGAPANTVTFGALGFDHRTAGHRGVVQLVSPFKVVSGITGNLSGFALQTLSFSGVPEPGALALLVTAAAALGLRGLVLSRRLRP
jgi:hypothetical protein